MKNRLEINLEIEFTPPFHSGTGLPAGLIDRGIKRNYQGVLYIPATTFKGVVRNKVEEFIQIFYHNRKEKTFYFSPNDSVNTNFMVCYLEKPAPVKNLFGSNVRQGLLHFSHLKMFKEDKDFFILPETPGGYDQTLQVQHRTQTRIYRTTKTVVSGALFQSEYGIKNLRFSGTITGFINKGPLSPAKGNPLVSRELFLLLGGLRMTDRIAGNKSIGMGVFIYNKLDVKINNKSIDINTDVFADHNFNIIAVNRE
ncbi:MAG: hypothetical protein JXB88_11380 [Spirochaetales bacterium]|nr:hypothetical protein [Spirochaetales bacterium]